MAEQSATDICNLALQWLGEDPILTFEDAPPPESPEYARKRSLCKLNYPNARDAVLEDGDWTFATRYDSLAQLADPVPNDPRPPLQGNVFKLESDVLRVILCDDGAGSFRISFRKVGTCVVANANTLYAENIVRITDTNQFSPGFVQALAARLAADLAIPMRDSNSLQERMWALYERKRDEALANDGRQGDEMHFRSDRLRSVRLGDGPATRWIDVSGGG